MYFKFSLFCVVLCVKVVVAFENDENMQKITVFGASGTIGKKVLERAIEKGLKPRAFTRNANKFTGRLKNQVEVFQGSVLEPEEVDKAIEGTDYVVIALGTGNSLSPTTDLSEGTKNIINSMKKYNVTIVSVCLSLFLYPEEEMPSMFGNVTEDHKRMYEELKDSGLNYIAVFPPYFTSERPHGDLLITLNGTKSPGQYISEKSLGSFLVDSLTEPKYYKNVVGLSNP